MLLSPTASGQTVFRTDGSEGARPDRKLGRLGGHRNARRAAGSNSPMCSYPRETIKFPVQ